MGNLTSDLISLLHYLLPGFLAAWIFYSFTSFKKPTEFERIIQALIFTIIIQSISHLTKKLLLFIGNFASIGAWDNDVAIIISLIIATALGFTFTFYSNNDKFHTLIRKANISKETSYPSEWYGEFSTKITYVVLHLKDGRRIYGWPKEWPSTPNIGHFSLLEAAWLDNENKETVLHTVDSILINSENVEMVEFMKNTWESNNE